MCDYISQRYNNYGTCAVESVLDYFTPVLRMCKHARSRTPPFSSFYTSGKWLHLGQQTNLQIHDHIPHKRQRIPQRRRWEGI